jgi:hypothetical protein
MVVKNPLGDEYSRGVRREAMNLTVFLIILVLFAGVITADHFKGPLFPDVFYCLNDGGAQKTWMCTGRVPP